MEEFCEIQVDGNRATYRYCRMVAGQEICLSEVELEGDWEVESLSLCWVPGE